jgi:hypothetical protein
MTPLPRLRQAMAAIAEEKGEFSLFGLFMRADSPGRWDLVVAAPWLEVGKLKALGEFVGLLEDQLGENEVRRFAKIVTLKASSPEIRSELATLDIDQPEKRFHNTTLFGADVEEAVILRAAPPKVSSGGPPNKPLQPTSRQRRADRKKRTTRATRG